LLSVSSDVKKLTKRIDKQYRRQIPFATSVALNSTAFDARADVQEALPKFLDRPSPFTIKGVQVKKSSKKKLISAVGFASKTFGKLPAGTGIPPAEYMKRLIKGGTRNPYNKYIAIPATKRDQNKYGSLKRGQVRRLLSNKAKYFGGVPKGNENWGFGIWERTGKGGRKSIRKRVIFVDQAKYEKKFPFKRLVVQTIKKTFSKNFQKAFKNAIKPR
tara:strand:- start:47 stop:694 length:648 start_codon:yes stop_codon:yes gene_type:complete